MSTFNFRYAQVAGDVKKPTPPNAIQNIAQSPVYQGIANPSGIAFNYAQTKVDPQSKAQLDKSYNDIKNQITTGLISFPTSVAYNPNIYNWTVNFVNSLVRNYDSVIIWMLEKGLNISTWIKNPFLAATIKAAEKYPERYKIIQNIGLKIIQRLKEVKGIKSIVGFINSGKNLQYEKALSEMPGLSRFNQDTLKEFLVDRNSLSAQRQFEIAKKLNEELSVGEKINIYKTTGTNLDDILRLGENASVYKQTAVKTFNGIAKALPEIAEFINKITPFIDVAISTIDFIDWLRVWHDTGWDKMSRVDQVKFGLSALKALATICYFIPGLQPIAPFLNLAISVLQSVGIEGAEQAGYLSAGMTKQQAEKIQQVSESAAGYEPKDPMIKAIYKLIKGWITNDLMSNPNIQKGKNLRQFIDEYVNKYINQQKDQFQISWMKNPNDPRTLELYNALSMILKSIKQADSSYNNRRYVICPSI